MKTILFILCLLALSSFGQNKSPLAIQFRQEVLKQAATNATPVALQSKFSLPNTNAALIAVCQQIGASTNNAQVGSIERKFTAEELAAARTQVYARPGFKEWKAKATSK